MASVTKTILAIAVGIAAIYLWNDYHSNSSARPINNKQISYRVAYSACRERGPLPDPQCTPGAINHSVNQSNIHSTICVVGYTRTIRPPYYYTEPLKISQMKNYGDKGSVRDYEEDHLVPLELGGSPTSPKNLWPEPYHLIFNRRDEGAYTKDGVEDRLRREVCEDNISLASAQRIFMSNWTKGL